MNYSSVERSSLDRIVRKQASSEQDEVQKELNLAYREEREHQAAFSEEEQTLIAVEN
jgi:hypothetical protein